MESGHQPSDEKARLLGVNVALPNSLQNLTFGNRFDQNFGTCVFAGSLRNLTFWKSFQPGHRANTNTSSFLGQVSQIGSFIV